MSNRKNIKTQKKTSVRISLFIFWLSQETIFTAGDRNRTGTVFPQQDFKSCASASSATPANLQNTSYFVKWDQQGSNL